MNITNKLNFTKEAVIQIEKIILENTPNKYFRISVKGGGCSGFKYDFTFDNKKNDDDILINKTVIDVDSLDLINGSVVDYKKEMIGNSFVIDNPKTTATCGCGMSFSV
jgi:iron-sulfur cluster insertion protein